MQYTKHPLQEPFWLPWEGTKQLWQHEESQQRPMAMLYGAPGSGLPALCKPRAAHSSLLRRALLNLRPATVPPVPAPHRQPQLIRSADPCCRELQEKLLSGDDAWVSLELGPGTSPGQPHVVGRQQQGEQQQ